jgi:hypothetical protein
MRSGRGSGISRITTTDMTDGTKPEDHDDDDDDGGDGDGDP